MSKKHLVDYKITDRYQYLHSQHMGHLVQKLVTTGGCDTARQDNSKRWLLDVEYQLGRKRE